MDSLNCDIYDVQLIRLCEELEEDQKLFEIGELMSQLHRNASMQIGRGAKRSATDFETEVPVKRNRPSTSRDHVSTSRDVAAAASSTEPSRRGSNNITPISPKWREAITHRIEEGRMQTMIAAGKGVKLEPGWYWDLAGTFLFTIYVMTALGFGAPVPQTMYGRCMSLLFAVFAVPTHVYLMVNASTCTIAQVDRGLKQWKKHLSTPVLENGDGRSIRNKDSPSSSVNSDVKTWRRARLWRLISVLTFGHCVPLACTLYYALGALIFGVPRQTSPLDIVLFPLQFTTGGGLATVEFHYRILYGFYVEGAMALVHCALATIRRSSSKPVNDMTVKYRLFSMDKCGQ